MAKAFGEIEASGEATTLTHPEWLALLLDQEASYRRDRRLHARLRYARLRHQAAVEDVDYRAARGLDRALFQKLTEGSWIDAHENLILCGPTGVGKSWLSSALGHKASGHLPQPPADMNDRLLTETAHSWSQRAIARGSNVVP